MNISGAIIETANFSLRGSSSVIEFDVEKHLDLVDVDESQIGQVIQNIVMNADQAMPGGGVIKVSAKNVTIGPEEPLPIEKGKYVMVSICDEGEGVPPENMPKMFDPYYSTKEGGTGLGLATSYSIIKNHNGTVVVESELEVGTTFYIYLPAKDKTRAANTRKRKRKKENADGSGKILLMDDDGEIRTVVGEMLTSLGYEADFAKDGKEAIDKYKKISSPAKNSMP